LNHALLWVVVAIVWYFLRYSGLDRQGVQITLVKVIDLVIMVYFTNYVLIPRLLYQKKYAWFALCFVAMVIASSLTKMQIIGDIRNGAGLFDLTDKAGLKDRIYDNVIPHFFLVIAGAAAKLIYDHSKMQRRLSEMAKEKAEAELNFLKSQINPHFLFNSLNSVYFLINKENTDARQALHKFSDMLRYQLYEMNGAKIPVEKEVAYLKDYVDLQKLRKDENYSVEFSCSSDVKGFSIEPLLLIPFVENAFKHISHHPGKSNFVKMDLHRSNGELRFHVENSKEAAPTTEHSGGIGLYNVKRRLELLYPGKHELRIGETETDFSVDLKLDIQ
jgi:hypothetical protein